jgi:hypothetical protein
MTKSILWNNRDSSGILAPRASVFNSSSVISVTHSLVHSWNPPGEGNWDGGDPSNAPLFFNPVDPSNAPTTYGDLDQQRGSPVFGIGATNNHFYLFLPVVVSSD